MAQPEKVPWGTQSFAKEKPQWIHTERTHSHQEKKQTDRKAHTFTHKNFA